VQRDLEEVEASAVVGIRTKASGIEERDVVNKIAIDVVTFDQDRLALKLGQIISEVLDLSWRPALANDSRRLPELGGEVGKGNGSDRSPRIWMLPAHSRTISWT
jgi:hypothetical protein